MRLSTSTNLFSYDRGVPYMVPLEHALCVCAGAGYRYLDANFCGLSRKNAKEAPLIRDDWQDTVELWKNLARRLGVSFKQAHAYFPLTSGVGEDGLPDGAFGEEMMRRSVVAARILGVEWMVVHPISVKNKDDPSLEASMKYNLDYFSKWHEFFREQGVGMAIENMIWGCGNKNVWADPANLIALVDQLNQPDIGICLDTGHAFLSGYQPEDCVRAFGSRLKATHIDDNHGNHGDEHLVPFMGKISWEAVIRALKEIGYENDFSFETQNLTAGFPAELQPELIHFSFQLGSYLLCDTFSQQGKDEIAL